MRYSLIVGQLLAGALLVAATPAVAADVTPGDPQAKAVQAAALLMVQGRSAESLAAIEPVLAAYEAQFAAEKRQIYCGMNPTETILYMGMAAQAKKNAIAVYPGWCDALFVKGFDLIDQKQVAAGLPFLERAVAMAPYHAHYLNELGYAHQALRDWTKSLDAYGRAAASAGMASESERKREQGRAWRGRGFALVEQGKWDEAADMYRQCLKLDPNDAKAKGELQYIAQTRPKTG